MAHEVTYADLNFSRRPPPTPAGVKRLPPPVALGLAGLSLLLLAAVVGLGAKSWQLSRQLQETSGAYEARSRSLLEAQQQLEATRGALEWQRRDREALQNATWAAAWKEPCPEQWVLLQGSCLFFSKERKPWEGSAEDCNRKASRLVVTKSWPLDHLPAFLQSYWVGLRKMSKEEPWLWVDGSLYSGIRNAGCAILANGRLELSRCSSRQQYICEMPAAPARQRLWHS